MSEHIAEQAIRIRAEPSRADPSSCKFTVSRTVHDGGPYLFDRQTGGAGSPLAERLFSLPGIASVVVTGNTVTVEKETDVPWGDLKRHIGAAIRAQMVTGAPPILETSSHAANPNRTDAEVRATVQELLDKEVNRSIASHGGKISILDYRDGELVIAMSGGCQGCAASKVTLRHGVEVMVRRVAPEVRAIVDATDHASGKEPFYRGSMRA